MLGWTKVGMSARAWASQWALTLGLELALASAPGSDGMSAVARASMMGYSSAPGSALGWVAASVAVSVEQWDLVKALKSAPEMGEASAVGSAAALVGALEVESDIPSVQKWGVVSALGLARETGEGSVAL